MNLIAPFLTGIPAGRFASFSDVKTFVKSLYAEYKAADAAGTLYENADQPPTAFAPGEGFICSDTDDQMLWANGFPDVLGSCSVCLANIIILEHNVATGRLGLLQVAMGRNP